MDARRASRLLLWLTVPASSVLGLGRAMAEGDPSVFADVWSANLWGDLVFTGGTVAAGVAVARLLARFRPDGRGAAFAAAVPASFLLHWAVYALSWTLTGSQLGGSFFALSLDGFPDAWGFTFEWGWPGLVAMAFASPGLALRAQRRLAAGAPPAAPQAA